MRRRPSVLVTGFATAVIAVSVAASSPQISEVPGNHGPNQVALLAVDPAGAPAAPVLAPVPQAPPESLAVVDSRASQATANAAQNGADVSFTLLDRMTGQQISDGDGAPFPIASVAKLFIADDLLLQVARGQVQLTPDDRQSLDVMLRSSDDNAAENFWNRAGGSAIIARVVDRYGLRSTSAPYDGHWWNTMSTTVDLVKYYSMLLDGTGGLPLQQANMMISDLAQSTPTGIDGYPQRFGIPDGLFAESVAVKQGWMCCWGPANQVHLSTGVVGPDRRYAIAVASMQPADEAAARNTLTQVIKAMFPGGRI